MKSIKLKPPTSRYVNEMLDELSPESRPTLSFEVPKKVAKPKLSSTKLMELFGIPA